MDIIKINNKLHEKYGSRFRAYQKDGSVFITGSSDDWSQIIEACQMCAKKYSTVHIVNDIVFTGGEIKPMKVPSFSDKSLDGASPDVLIIGGGISGASIARELSKWDIDILLVEKENDVAMQASGRNDGEVHPGVDLGKGAKTISFMAASEIDGGTIMMTVDSDSGNQIFYGIVDVKNTKGKFKKMKAKVAAVSGVHDLTFQFLGPDSDLMKLDWWQLK